MFPETETIWQGQQSGRDRIYPGEEAKLQEPNKHGRALQLDGDLLFVEAILHQAVIHRVHGDVLEEMK